MEEEEGNFDGLFRVAAVPAYREIVRDVEPGFPDWLVPSSALDVRLLERVCRALQVGAGSTTLDLACGGGGPTLWVAQQTGSSVVGVDSCALGVEAAQRLAERLGLAQRARFVRADATATGLPDGSVDGVMSFYALMFIEPATAAREIARVLRPGGMAVILTAEALLDPPPLPTLVPDYTPLFEAENLKMLEREAIDESLWHAFFHGVQNRAEALRKQAGHDAEALVDEAARWFERRENPPARDVFLVAQRR